MSLQLVIEKLSGTSTSLQLPLFVYDDGTPPAEIDEEDVKAFVDSKYGTTVPSEVLGVPEDGDPHLVRLSRSAWRVTINYRVATLRPLTPVGVGEARNRFQFSAPRIVRRFAPEVGAFPNALLAALGGAPTWHGLMNVVEEQGAWPKPSPTVLDPPPVSFVTEQSFAPNAVTTAQVRELATVIQSQGVNSDSLQSGEYLAGELTIGFCNGEQISAGAWRIETGWCWQRNVTGEVRDTVTGVAYEGHDYVWDWWEPFVDRNKLQLGYAIKATYVNRVRPRFAFGSLLVSPP